MIGKIIFPLLPSMQASFFITSIDSLRAGLSTKRNGEYGKRNIDSISTPAVRASVIFKCWVMSPCLRTGCRPTCNLMTIRSPVTNAKRSCLRATNRAAGSAYTNICQFAIPPQDPQRSKLGCLPRRKTRQVPPDDCCHGGFGVLCAGLVLAEHVPVDALGT